MITIEYAKNPFYNDVNNETIFLTVKFEEFTEEMPFTATPYDDMDYGRQLCANAKNGDYGTVRPWNENPCYSPPEISSDTLKSATKDVEYNEVFSVQNAKSPYVITAIDQLPSNLIIENNSISGIPTTLGNFTFTVSITDGLGNTGTSKLKLLVA